MFMNKWHFNISNGKKYKQDSTQNQSVQVHRKMVRDDSPDPSRQASNQIIQQIQKKGLKCVWNEIQQTKTQYTDQDQWRQNQILHRTFSQCSSPYRKSLSQNVAVDRFSRFFNPPVRNYEHPHIIMQGNNQFINQAGMRNSQYIIADKIKYYDNSVFEINPLNIGNDPRTTLMIKNIPNKYTIQDLSNQIDQNFADSYDFLYLPCDIKNNCNVGYGFINFVDTQILFDFYKKFHNKRWIKFRSDKICVLTYARLQGLDSLIQHFQNSKVLNHKDKRYQPIIIKNNPQSKKIDNLIQQQKKQQSAVNL